MANLADAAVTLVGTQLIRRAKWTYLGYGLVAYAGLRVLKHYNVLPKQVDEALGLINRVAGIGPTQGPATSSMASQQSV